MEAMSEAGSNPLEALFFAFLRSQANDSLALIGSTPKDNVMDYRSVITCLDPDLDFSSYLVYRHRPPGQRHR